MAVKRFMVKRSRVVVRECHRQQAAGRVRIWVVVGLVNCMEPWLGSTLNSESIDELLARENTDLEFELES